MDSTERVNPPPVCLCTGQHRRHILCNTVKGLRGSTF